MKKRTTENIKPDPKMNNEQQTIDKLPAKLLPIRMLGVRLSQSVVSCQFFQSAFCSVWTKKDCLL